MGSKVNLNWVPISLLIAFKNNDFKATSDKMNANFSAFY